MAGLETPRRVASDRSTSHRLGRIAFSDDVGCKEGATNRAEEIAPFFSEDHRCRGLRLGSILSFSISTSRDSKVEEQIRGQPPDIRRDIRQSRSGPLLDALYRWFKDTLTQVSAQSDLAIAIRYALSRWKALTRFAADGLTRFASVPPTCHRAHRRSSGQSNRGATTVARRPAPRSRGRTSRSSSNRVAK